MSDWQDVMLPPGWRLVVLEETGSTNDEVRLRCQDEAGLVVLAEKQTAGRGRRGAAWLSIEGESLTFSVLLRPSEPKAIWPRLSLAAGMAVADALGRYGIEAEIKWPNDLLIGGKKISGILVEAGADYVVVGIGLNLGTLQFPEGLEATSMAMESGRSVQGAEVLSFILTALDGWSREIGGGFPDLLKRVRERCALSGRQVRLISGNRVVEGQVVQIGNSGELIVNTPDGPKSFLQAHEVRPI
ncbi:biotin--[acetyl-CoA-carboxylase] ligase [Haloferula sp.]|uniref:biotin--[acetyl-CoA-carboxylase] ligase n=1 Tax=Haloferula sp. TaxID=2497595 RepID=UPI003C78A70F